MKSFAYFNVAVLLQNERQGSEFRHLVTIKTKEIMHQPDTFIETSIVCVN